MRPTLPNDCEIEVVPLAGPAPIGALLVFVADDRLVVHRLVRRAGARWVTQGDGVRTPDPPLAADQVLGVVTAAYWNGRRCWPGRGARRLAWFWIARHYGLWTLRRIWRALRRFRAALRAEIV